MRLAAIVLGVFVLAGSALAQQLAKREGVGGSNFHKNDITYSMEVETPHCDWASVLPGGPIKGFFIPPVSNGRDMVELMQRISLAPTTVTIDSAWDRNCWGIGDYYGHEYRGDRDDFVIVHSYVEKDLTGPADFEVMLIPSMNGWSRLTEPTRGAILKRVSEGAGLVLIRPGLGDVERRPMKGDPDKPDLRLWDISPLVAEASAEAPARGRRRGRGPSGVWNIVTPHFITEGLALELLPEGTVGNSYSNYKASGDVIIAAGDRPVMAVKQYGKGRVVAFAYDEAGFAPRTIDPLRTKIYWNYWEYQYSLLAKSILWAAGRESGVDIEALSAAAEGDRARVSMSVLSDAPRRVSVEVAGHGKFGAHLGSELSEVSLARGENSIQVTGEGLAPSAGWPGGKAIYDVIIKDAATGATLNWGAAVFTTPQASTIESVKSDSQLHHRGDTLAAVVVSKGDLTGLKLRFTVKDDLDRTLSIQTADAAAETAFECELEHYLGKYAFLTAQLVNAAGAVVDELRGEPVLVVQRPEERRPTEYVAMVSFGGSGKHFLTNVRARLVRAAGAQTGFTWGGAVNNSLRIPRGSFGVYWYDRGPTDEAGLEAAIKRYEETQDLEGLQYLVRKELFRRIGDKKFLARVPCFDDSEFMQRLYEGIRDTAAGKSKYNLDYYFVGDEGSLTSYTDNVDFCFDERTLAAERQWLKTQYDSLDALNASWKTSFATWDEVTPYTTEEAKKAGHYAAWGDHRTYMELTFANAYTTVRKAVIDGDPAGHIALSGTQQPNSYNGCDWYRLDQVIDDFLAYTGGGQLDLHRSFAKPEAMLGFWTGYGSSGIAVQNAIWTNAVHGFLYPNIFWMPSYLNPDLTYSQSARDMGEAFKQLRFEGVGKLFLESERLQDGIALHFSMPSVHAASITENSPERGVRPKRNFVADRAGWIEIIKDLGMFFDFVAYEQVETGALASGKYKAFVMPMSMALSPEESAAIKAFAECGGVVVADAAAGVMDDHCAWLEDGALNGFFGIRTQPSSKRDYGSSTVISQNWEGDEVASDMESVEQAMEVTPEGAAWGLSADDFKGVEVVEPNLSASTGTALLKIGGADAVIARQVGKGWAIYLNVLLDKYSDRRKENFGGADYRNLVRAVLARTGISPVVGVFDVNGNPVERILVVRYRFAGDEVLAIVKENVGLNSVEGRDGVTYFNDEELGEVARESLTIKLPRKYFVNDVRTGKRMGLTDTVNIDILVGGAVVLGLAPDENRITVTGPAKAALGAHVQFDLTSTQPDRSLVRCHFQGPDGTFLPAYAQNVVIQKGRGSVVLPSALSDAHGTYVLKVTDAVTGAAAEASINMQ